MELDFDKYKAQQCCDNPACPYSAQTEQDHMRPQSRPHHQGYGHAGKNIGVIPTGTFFDPCKAPVALILGVVQLLAEGRGLRAGCRPTGVPPDAVGDWI